MKKQTNTGTIASRVPLSRERILSTALALADKDGLDSVSMRQVAQGLGVEAMSLYKHVANKDDILDGLVELVVAKMSVPSANTEWKEALRERAYTVRKILNSHPWAANLLESRTNAGPARLRHLDSMIGILRKAGFSIELAFNAMIALTSYVYGFVILEEGFKLKARPKAAGNVQLSISPDEYPYILEMMNFVYAKNNENSVSKNGVEPVFFADFEFGLNHLVEGLGRLLETGQLVP
jgi:AcrR family transcriptional regulator